MEVDVKLCVPISKPHNFIINLYSHTDNTGTLHTAVAKMYSKTNNSVTSGVTPKTFSVVMLCYIAQSEVMNVN